MQMLAEERGKQQQKETVFKCLDKKYKILMLLIFGNFYYAGSSFRVKEDIEHTNYFYD